MIKGLHTLIRLHKRHLDVLRRSLGELERKKADLLAISAKLERELQEELILANTQLEMSSFFGDFADRIAKKQQQIAEDVAKLDELIIQLTDQIAEQFSEMKKYELARDAIIAREKEEASRKERILLDEIGLQQFTRQEEGSA